VLHSVHDRVAKRGTIQVLRIVNPSDQFTEQSTSCDNHWRSCLRRLLNSNSGDPSSPRRSAHDRPWRSTASLRLQKPQRPNSFLPLYVRRPPFPFQSNVKQPSAQIVASSRFLSPQSARTMLGSAFYCPNDLESTIAFILFFIQQL
jgi:hypothetical protein